MSMHIAADHIEQVADIVEQPHHTVVDRNFGLPGGLYAVSAGGYLAFIAMMASIFGNGQLAIPMTIFVLFIACAFGIPDPEWGEVSRVARGDMSWPTDGGPDTLRAVYAAGDLAKDKFRKGRAGDTYIVIADWAPDGSYTLDTIHQYGSATSQWIRETFLELGIVVRPLGHTIYWVPPYCTQASTLEHAYETLMVVLARWQNQKAPNTGSELF